MSDHVARLWPELLDIEAALQRLTAQPHVVTRVVRDTTSAGASGGISDQDLARRVARELSKPGGPRIASRAIA